MTPSLVLYLFIYLFSVKAVNFIAQSGRTVAIASSVIGGTEAGK